MKFEDFVKENFNCTIKPRGNNRYIVQTSKGINFGYFIEHGKILINEIYVFDEVKEQGMCTELIKILKSSGFNILVVDIVSCDLDGILKKLNCHQIDVGIYNTELTRSVYTKHKDVEFGYSEYEEEALEDGDLEALIQEYGMFDSYIVSDGGLE